MHVCVRAAVAGWSPLSLRAAFAATALCALACAQVRPPLPQMQVPLFFGDWQDYVSALSSLM